LRSGFRFASILAECRDVAGEAERYCWGRLNAWTHSFAPCPEEEAGALVVGGGIAESGLIGARHSQRAKGLKLWLARN